MDMTLFWILFAPFFWITGTSAIDSWQMVKPLRKSFEALFLDLVIAAFISALLAAIATGIAQFIYYLITGSPTIKS